MSRGTGPRADAAPKLLVVKVGGSLVSDKSADRDLDLAAVDAYARQIADLARRRPGRVVLVAGGGSFGHGAVRHLDDSDPFAALGLTEATFAVKWAWTKALRAHGTAAMPLQVAALCVDDGETVTARTEVLRHLLSLGAVPVLSGDCVVTAEGRLRVFGSDHVPGILLDGGAAHVRIVTLTDVPGVLLDGPGGHRVLPHVDPRAPRAAQAALWGTASWDTSGSMHGKLTALVAHAERGAECVITRGDPAARTLPHLLAPLHQWPVDLPRTVISLGRQPRPTAKEYARS